MGCGENPEIEQSKWAANTCARTLARRACERKESETWNLCLSLMCLANRDAVLF